MRWPFTPFASEAMFIAFALAVVGAVIVLWR
jgi:hypothetical protein